MKYLGHTISRQGIAPDVSKVEGAAGGGQGDVLKLQKLGG